MEGVSLHMQRVIALDTIQEILEYRFVMSPDFQPVSFITPGGEYVVLHEDHHEAYQWLVVEQFVQCIPDAESLLSELGYIPYSFIGYLTLAYKEPTPKQYETLRRCLYDLCLYKQQICIYVSNNTRYSLELKLNPTTVESIIKRIKKFYSKGVLKK